MTQSARKFEKMEKTNWVSAHSPEFDSDERYTFPPDAERFALGLEDDRKLVRAKLIAGIATELALAGMLITALQEPGRETAILLALIMGALALLIMFHTVPLWRKDRMRIPGWEVSHKSSATQNATGDEKPQQHHGRLCISGPPEVHRRARLFRLRDLRRSTER
jgi:hypothetical protein